MICLGLKDAFVVVHPNRLHLRPKSKPISHSLIRNPSPSRVLGASIYHRKTVIVNKINPIPILIPMAKADAAGEIMLTSGASGRVTALLSMQVLKSLLMLVNAFLLLLFFPFRGRKRCHSGPLAMVDKGGKEEKQEVGNSSNNNNRKGGLPVMRVPSTIVPWKSSVSAAAMVDQEVALRRALAIRKVTDGGDVSRRDFSLFVTPRGETMFTQSWTPISVKTRALVVLLHGLNEHSGRYDEFAKQLNAQGYKVYGMDWVGAEIFWMPNGAKARLVKSWPSMKTMPLEQLKLPICKGNKSWFTPTISGEDEKGHGGSDGLHAYVHSLDDAVTDVKAFIRHVMAENTGLQCFCFGHSTGGAIILKAVLDPKIENLISGVVLTSPAVGVQPSHPIFLILAPVFSFLLPKFQLSAANKKGTAVSRDPAALVAKYSDPLVYTGSIRVRTGHEILRITSYLQRNMQKLKVPFLVLHGTADTVTDPDASLKLYNEASSEDKSIKLLPGYLHDLLFEPEREDIKRDIIQWLNSRV